MGRFSRAQHAVYRCYASDRTLLYIGATYCIEERLEQHQNTTAWWSEVDDVAVRFYANRGRAISAERSAILLENPKYNRQRYRPRSAPSYRVLTTSPYAGSAGPPLTSAERIFLMTGEVES